LDIFLKKITVHKGFKNCGYLEMGMNIAQTRI